MRHGPTLFQLNYFVVGKEPTAQAKMQRCLTEIDQRESSVDAALREVDELNDLNALIDIDIGRLACPPEEAAVRARQLLRRAEANRRQADTLLEKVACWRKEVAFLKHLYDQVAARETLRDWDDYDVQLEYWGEKLAREIGERTMLGGTVDTELLRTVLALPDAAPVKRQVLEAAKLQLTDR